MLGDELDHRVDVFNVEVGDGPRTLSDDDEVSKPTRCGGTLSTTSRLASAAERHAVLFETRSTIEARPDWAVAGGTYAVAAKSWPSGGSDPDDLPP